MHNKPLVQCLTYTLVFLARVKYGKEDDSSVIFLLQYRKLVGSRGGAGRSLAFFFKALLRILGSAQT